MHVEKHLERRLTKILTSVSLGDRNAVKFCLGVLVFKGFVFFLSFFLLCLPLFFFTIKIYITSVQFSSVQFSCSVVSASLGPHGLQHASPPCPSPTPGVYSNSCIESVMPSNHLILCRPLLLPPSIIPSIRVFSSESALHIRWPKYWSFSFNISPSKEYSGLISFRMDWLDLLASVININKDLPLTSSAY